MKTLTKSFQNIKKATKSKTKDIELLEEVTFLAQNNLSTNEIEEFLGIKLSDFNEEYFKKNFYKYHNLFSTLNSLELIAYISFDQKLKKSLTSSLIKKIMYPVFLIVFAFVTLITFKFSILPLFESFSDKSFLVVINLFYYASLSSFLFIIIFSIFTIYIFKNPTYFIILYYRFYKFRVFKIIELYYISVLSHLLISFDNQGLSTFQTFELINKFKGNTIIANLAYFVSVDLADGAGLENSIKNMQIDENFKNILIMGMRTNNYNILLNKYNDKNIRDIYKEIDYISRLLLITSYLYIGIIVLLLYKILSLPISLMDQI